MNSKLERVTVERKLWCWFKDSVDGKDLEACHQVLDLLERVMEI